MKHPFNKVGYAGNELRLGNKMIAPQFEACDGKEINLTSVVPVGANIFSGIAATRLTAYGTTAASYLYTDSAGEDEEDIGWADPITNELVTDATLAPGEGLWVSASGSTASLQGAGAVRAKDSAVQLRLGNTPTGNPYPVAVSVQDILMEGKEGVSPYGVAAVKLSAYGTSEASYLYTDSAGEDEEDIGWADPITNELVEDTVLPGEGLWVSASSDKQWMTFPAPECLTEDK